jgi:glycine oxidase
VLDLLRPAADLLPGIAELALAETLAGLRPGTPDNAPVIARLPGHGVLVATGHHRNGVLLAPVTAAAIADLALLNATNVDISAFGCGRFT